MVGALKKLPVNRQKAVLTVLATRTHTSEFGCVSPDAQGKRELQRLRAIAKELEDEFFGTLAREDRDTLHRLLSELACAHDPRCAFAPTVSSKPD